MTTLSENLVNALKRWNQILPATSILTSSQDLQTYGQTTGFHDIRPSAILLPRSHEDVVASVKAAFEFNIPLYPISCGKNWGYGDACAPTAGQVILDLSRMNRIIEVNKKLGYAVIEPGVTQGQLWDYLAKNKTGLWMDATGAGPQTSLVGNTADRGFGHTRYGDHFQNTCGMEVVLSDGRVLKTGFGHYKGARSTFVYRYGVGPILDGLFSQSNFGIITQIGIWLMPEPEDFCAFFFSCPKDDDLAKVIDLLAPLKLHGVLQSAVHVANDLRTLSGKIGYPWHLTNGITPLPDAIRTSLRESYGFGAWNGCGSISGPKDVVTAIKKNLKKSLRTYRPIFLNDRKLFLAEKVIRVLPNIKVIRTLKEKLSIVRPTYEMLKGVPVTEHVKGASWRVRNRSEVNLLDPIKSGAGLIWVSPILPLDGSQAQEIMNILTPTYKKYGFETLVTFTLLTERCLCCVTNISFDRSHKEETEKAQKCYNEIVEKLMAEGFFPYRTGPSGFEKLARHSTVFWDVVSDLKKALDPTGILSPGRYSPKV